MKNTRLLIDADILVYSAAAMEEISVSFAGDQESNEEPIRESDIERIKGAIGLAIEDLEEQFKADAVVCLSDPRRKYFRHRILDTYKHNRVGLQAPLWLHECKEWTARTFKCKWFRGLEADDVMGILATRPNPQYARTIIVSEDKDLLQIPGSIYQPRKKKVIKVTPDEGQRWHLVQALIGDTVDGYSGCPGIGPVAAEEILSSPFLWESYEHTFQRGPRKGTEETRWRKVRPEEGVAAWDSIVSNYQKKGLTEEDALVQTRLAKILTAEDFNIAEGRIKLWSPEGHPEEFMNVE